MLKSLLILVPLVAVSEATVARVSLVKPDWFDDTFLPASHYESVEVFCSGRGYVIQCVEHDKEVTFTYPDRPQIAYKGKAGAYVYKDVDNADCKKKIVSEDKQMAYLLMDKCDDAKDAHLYSYKLEVPEKRADLTLIEYKHSIEYKVRDENGMPRWEACLTDKFDATAEYPKRDCIIMKQIWLSKWPQTKVDWQTLPKGPLEIPDPLAGDTNVYGNDNSLPQYNGRGSASVLDQSESTGLTRKSKSSKDISPPKIGPTVYCDKGAYSCLSCSSGRVCVPTKDGQKYFEISRFACTALYPYCNYTTGVCSSSPDPACFNMPTIVESKNFICMRDGFYPDPKSCTKFYYCRNKKAYENNCPYHPTPYYHPRLKHCVASKDFCAAETSAKYCKKRDNFGRKVPVLFTKNYFIYCGTNKNVLSVDRCIGAYFYDPNYMTCRFVCPHEGLFLSMEDCGKYIKCSPRLEGGFTRTDLDCPKGTAFLESEYACVERSLVPNCNQAHPDAFSK